MQGTLVSSSGNKHDFDLPGRDVTTLASLVHSRSGILEGKRDSHPWTTFPEALHAPPISMAPQHAAPDHESTKSHGIRNTAQGLLLKYDDLAHHNYLKDHKGGILLSSHKGRALRRCPQHRLRYAPAKSTPAYTPRSRRVSYKRIAEHSSRLRMLY